MNARIHERDNNDGPPEDLHELLLAFTGVPHPPVRNHVHSGAVALLLVALIGTFAASLASI